MISTLLLTLPASAQWGLTQRAGQWVDKVYASPIGLGFELLDDQNHEAGKVMNPGASSIKVIDRTQPLKAGGRSISPGFSGGTWLAGREVERDEAGRGRLEVVKLQDGTWQSIGVATLPRNEIVRRVLPMSKDRVLLIGGLVLGMVQSPAAWKEWSPFLVFRRDATGALVFESYLDADLPQDAKDPVAWDLGSNMITVVGDHAIVCGPKHAQIRVIDLEKRRVTRARSFFGDYPEGVKASTRFAHPMVLGMYPMPDGTVRFLTRSRGAWEDRAKEQAQSEEFKKVLMASNGRVPQHLWTAQATLPLRNHPELLWWDFDPETGKLTQLGTPPKGCISRAENPSDLDFLYRPHLDGSLRRYTEGTNTPVAPTPKAPVLKK